MFVKLKLKGIDGREPPGVKTDYDKRLSSFGGVRHFLVRGVIA